MPFSEAGISRISGRFSIVTPASFTPRRCDERAVPGSPWRSRARCSSSSPAAPGDCRRRPCLRTGCSRRRALRAGSGLDARSRRVSSVGSGAVDSVRFRRKLPCGLSSLRAWTWPLNGCLWRNDGLSWSGCFRGRISGAQLKCSGFASERWRSGRRRGSTAWCATFVVPAFQSNPPRWPKCAGRKAASPSCLTR